MMLKFAEVFLTQAVKGRAVELGRSADEVVHLRLERLPLLVIPGIGRHVPVVDEDVLGLPVRRLARGPVAPLEQQDSLSGRREMSRQRATARARSDDDDVVGLHCQLSSSISGTM